MIKDLYTSRWLEFFPVIYPGMSLQDFKDYNEDMIYELLDVEINNTCNNYEWAREPELEEYNDFALDMWENLVLDAAIIKERKPSKVKNFSSRWLAQTFADVMYKTNGMIHMPVWSPKDDRYLLFFVTMR